MVKSMYICISMLLNINLYHKLAPSSGNKSLAQKKEIEKMNAAMMKLVEMDVSCIVDLIV